MPTSPYIRILVLLAALLSGLDLMAQPQKNFRHAGVDEGLSQSTVLGITQDKEGFVWLATRDGLNRFDGYDFTTYYKDTGIHKLPSGFVKEIFRDSRGYLWTGTSNGLRVYHADRNAFYTPDEHTGFATGIPPQVEVWKIYEYPKNNIWLLTLQHGLFICNTQSRTILHFDQQNSPLQHSWIRSMAVNALGQLYLCTPHQVYEISRPTNNSFKILPPCITGVQQDSADIGIQDLLFETNDRLWIGRHNTGIAVWNIRNRSWQPAISYYPIRVLFRDKDSTIWAGSFGAGLFRYARNQPPEQLQHQAFSPGSLRSNFIRSLYQDKQGVLWIGTEDEGVSLYDPNRNKIISYDYRDWRLEQFKNVRAIYAEDDKIYTGSNVTQLGMFDLGSKKMTTIQPPAQPEQHKYDIITQILPQSNDQLLVSTYGSGLFILDKKKLQLQKLPGTNTVQNITRLVNRTDHTIWICTNHGFYLYQPASQQWTDMCATQSSLKQLSNTYIKTVFEQNDTLWIATDHQGLFAYQLSSQQLLPIGKDQRTLSLPFAVNAFLPANNGIWMATYDNGLVYLTTKTGQITTAPQQHKRGHQPILQLLRDNQGNIWQSTNRGLIQFAPFSKRTRYFDQYNGTQGQEYYIGSAYKDPTGRLWFGGKNGFDCILPGRIGDDPPPLPVYITGMRIQEQELLPDTNIAFKKQITLNYAENFLTINFTAPDFRLPADNQYLYRMHGVDKQWVRAGNIRQARYTGLPGGSYVFEVSVMGNDGNPTGTPARLQITIRQPFWNTWLFYILVLVLIASLVYVAWRYRLYQVEAVYRMRNTISRDLHDDIGGTLSSIHILTEVARQKALQNQGAQSAGILEKVNSLALEMVSRMGDTIWAISPSSDNPDKLLERLRNQFLPACTAKGIHLELQTKGTQQAVTADMNKRKQMYMITKEILNNALKHSGGNHISMFATCSSKNFQLTITDNGTGFNATQSASGNGLRNIRERVTAVKGKVDIDTAPGRGTTVSLVFPLP